MIFSSRKQTRIWYNGKTGEVRFVLENPGILNHSQDVIKNPEHFGLNPGQLDHINMGFNDYNGEALWSAMQNKWVRIVIDFRDTKKGGTNVEGISWLDITSAARWLYAFNPGMEQFSVVLRKGPGTNDGRVYRIFGQKYIDFFLKWGRPLRDDESWQNPPEVVTDPYMTAAE